jgi:hypothetical protein
LIVEKNLKEGLFPQALMVYTTSSKYKINITKTINMKKIIFIAISLTFSFQVYSWGQTGHRVVGEIAEKHLTRKAKRMIHKLLPNEDLAEASTYSDEQRSNPIEFWQKTANPWHYVNVHEGKVYESAPPEGDAVTALEMFSKQLKSKESSLEDKQIALRFIVHIIGDLHQPFHSGTDLDRGGNSVKVTFFGEESNIHRVWDENLIDNQRLSYTEWTYRLNRKISRQQVKGWSQVDPRVWIAESQKLRLGLYPENERLFFDYQYKAIPIVKQRLQMGGIRLAAYLNHLFK